MAIELLAPAGNIEIARSAIMSGADAIYIGAPSFGARQSAGNSMEDIARLLDYAHLFDVRVYLTMNTILYDNEIDDAYAIAKRAEEIGADALIVQDMAYLEMGLSRIPLHASTQAFNFDLEKIKLISKSGFDRIVLERSLTLQEIREIRKNVPQELECFIHGAMCVGYSGRCYLSEFLCGRSGNRGACSQPCRSQYDIYSEDGKFLRKSSSILSVSDLNFSSSIKDFIDSGVCSLKIEGRLKDESYVVNNVSYYNHILNTLHVERSSKGMVQCDFTPNPRKSFSRGFSGQMFLKNPRAKVGAPTKSLGEKLGIVENSNGNVVRLKNNPSVLHNGDGVCWLRDSKQFGAYINGIKGHDILLSSVSELKPGDVLYRNFDKEFQPSSRNVSRKLPVHLKIDGENKIRISSGYFLMEFLNDFPEAKNTELAIKNLQSSFSKTGDYPFEINSISIDLKRITFIPSSSLNTIRREFLSSYMQYLLENYKPLTRQMQTADSSLVFPEKLSYEWNVSNKLSSRFYINHGAKEIEPAFELQDNRAGKVVMKSRHCIRREMGICPKDNSNISAASPLILENNSKKLKVVFDCKTCQMNLISL